MRSTRSARQQRRREAAAAFDQHAASGRAARAPQAPRPRSMLAGSVRRHLDELDAAVGEGAGAARRRRRARTMNQVGTSPRLGDELRGQRHAQACHRRRSAPGCASSSPCSRQVSRGSSAITVLLPTMTASWRGAQQMGARARRLAGDPAALAARGGDPAVEGRGELQRDERPAPREPRRNPALISRRLRRRRARSRPRCRRRAAARCPCRRRADRDPRSRTTTRATPAAISASAQGGVLPQWQHGSRLT